jgi:predicted N-acetyltransferase YhbS
MTGYTLAPDPPSASDQDASLAGLVWAYERPQDAEAVQTLVDAAFGPGRFAKVSERVRERAVFRPDLSICAWREARLVGTVRQWRVRVGRTPCVFLGPIAVDRSERSQGVGAGLVRRAIGAAAAAGEAIILLVGDVPLFAPYGFEPVPAGRVLLPGPVDPGRVLWRPLAPGALEGVEGPVLPP